MPGPVNLAQAAPVDGWLARIGRGLWAPRCLVCAEGAAGPLDLCTRCAAALPWMPPACLCCAMPLPAPASASALSRPVGAATAATGATRGCPAIPVAAVAAPTGGWVAAGRLCSACQRHPPALAQAHAAFLYGFPLDRLLPRLKFHRDFAAGRVLAQCMAERFAGLPRPQALLPVPLHRGRLRLRGFDQALELARPLARALDLPLHAGLLHRCRATHAQSRLDADARARNLRGAFRVDAGTALPAHVALVDDVMTTGATLHAAAKALRAAGVARIDAWVCARVA